MASGKSRVIIVSESGLSLMLAFESRNLLERDPNSLSDTGKLVRKTPRRSSPKTGSKSSLGTTVVEKRFVTVFGGANEHTDGRASLCVLTKISLAGWRDAFNTESISRMLAECALSTKRRACESLGV